jgi:hypothetical protein
VGFPSADSVGFTGPGLSASLGRVSPLTGTFLLEKWKKQLEPLRYSRDLTATNHYNKGGCYI